MVGSSSTRHSGQSIGGISAEQGSASCCCCTAACALMLSSGLTLIFGIGVTLLGVFINQTIHGWQLEGVDLLGWLCVGLGGFLATVSLVGICAARCYGNLVRFLHFTLLLLTFAALLLSCIYAAVENANVGAYINDNWEQIQEGLGLNALSNEGELRLEEVHGWIIAIAAVGGVAVLVLAISLGASMQLLGARRIAFGFLTTLGLLGGGEASIAYLSFGHVPPATSYLLVGCAGVQVLCCASGICGFRWHNRECLCFAFTVLFLTAIALGYVAFATYLWLRQTTPELRLEQGERQEGAGNLLLVFCIASVADFFMLSTLLFVAVLYCKRRSAFTHADKSAEMTIEFSDYDRRDRPSRSKRSRGRAGSKGGAASRSTPREYLQREAL